MTDTGEQVSMDFGTELAAKPKKTGRFEVHEHIFISGPRSNGVFIAKTEKTTSHFSHSHEGGDKPHKHPDTGPANYTIDKDEWFRTTGMIGGGRKKFTQSPAGEQFPIAELEDWQKSFEIVVAAKQPDIGGSGADLAPAFRMILGSKMTVSAVRGTDKE